MKAEDKAMELYPVKNQHVPTIGGRTAYVDVNEKARKAFLKGYEDANQQPEQDKVRELYGWLDKYNITIQGYNGEFQIYISRDDVYLFEIGGRSNMYEAIDEAIEWLNRVNSKKH